MKCGSFCEFGYDYVTIVTHSSNFLLDSRSLMMWFVSFISLRCWSLCNSLWLGMIKYSACLLCVTGVGRTCGLSLHLCYKILFKSLFSSSLQYSISNVRRKSNVRHGGSIGARNRWWYLVHVCGVTLNVLLMEVYVVQLKTEMKMK